MALDTYTNLQTALGNWLNRSDLTSFLPDFITLAEARFNRELRTNQMVKRASASISTAYVAMPNDWLETRSIRVTSNTTYNALDYITPEEFYDLQNDLTTADVPRYWTIIDSNIYLLPTPSTTYTLEQVYYGKTTSLATSGTGTNWLLDKSPDLYLFGSLIAAEAFIMNDERLPIWAAAVDKIIADMNMESERAIRPRGQLHTKKRTFG